MKQMKLISIIAFICAILISLSTLSYAVDDSFELQLNALSDEVVLGNTFEVEILLDNMNVTSGDQGIGAYAAKITYDAEVLELVSVQQQTGWEVMENEGNIVALTTDGEVVTDRTLTAKATFKVKDDAQLGDTEISLESISGSSGTATIQGTGVSTTVQIVEQSIDPGDDDENTAGGNNTVGDDNTAGGNNTTTGDDNTVGGNNTTTGGNNAIRNNTSIQSNVDSTTTANKTLPYAGFTGMMIILIAVLIVAAIIFYLKYRRLYKI